MKANEKCGKVLEGLILTVMLVSSASGELVAHYRFDTDFSDSSGHNLHGTPQVWPSGSTKAAGQSKTKVSHKLSPQVKAINKTGLIWENLESLHN